MTEAHTCNGIEVSVEQFGAIFLRVLDAQKRARFAPEAHPRDRRRKRAACGKHKASHHTPGAEAGKLPHGIVCKSFSRIIH